MSLLKNFCEEWPCLCEFGDSFSLGYARCMATFRRVSLCLASPFTVKLTLVAVFPPACQSLFEDSPKSYFLCSSLLWSLLRSLAEDQDQGLHPIMQP